MSFWRRLFPKHANVIIEIDGLSQENWQNVERVLERISGINTPLYAGHGADINYLPEQVTPDEIVKILQANGWNARIK